MVSLHHHWHVWAPRGSRGVRERHVGDHADGHVHLQPASELQQPSKARGLYQVSTARSGLRMCCCTAADSKVRMHSCRVGGCTRTIPAADEHVTQHQPHGTVHVTQRWRFDPAQPTIEAKCEPHDDHNRGPLTPGVMAAPGVRVVVSAASPSSGALPSSIVLCIPASAAS